MQNIGFAATSQEAELNEILQGHGMGLAGDIDEHVVLTESGKLLGGALIWQLGEALFHLLVLGVCPNGRGKGYGRRLLAEICADPWRYCRDVADRGGEAYRITTMARGEAAPFYQKCGFAICTLSEIPDPFAGQCDECPDRAACNPAPMIFTFEADPNSGRSEA